MYSPWILLDASRTRKVPSGVSRSFSFTSSLRGHPGLGTRPETLPFRPCPPHGPLPQPYLEMSPQYHSASCREGGFPPLARPAGAGFALGGLGGRAGGQENKCILSTKCILWLAPTATELVDTGRAPSQHSWLPTIRDHVGRGGHLGVRPPAPPDVPEATSPPAAPGSQGWTQSWGGGECSG